jgi:hypothetical protein
MANWDSLRDRVYPLLPTHYPVTGLALWHLEGYPDEWIENGRVSFT